MYGYPLRLREAAFYFGGIFCSLLTSRSNAASQLAANRLRKPPSAGFLFHADRVRNPEEKPRDVLGRVLADRRPKDAP